VAIPLVKFQISSTESQTNSKLQIQNRLVFWVLGFDIVWDLEFGAWGLSSCEGASGNDFCAATSANYYNCLQSSS
jgi:hypothetical protein